MEKLWFFGLGHTDTGWEICGPQEIELEQDLLDSIGFGEKRITQLYLTDQNRVLYLFRFKEAAQLFADGFTVGKLYTKHPEDMWNDYMLKTIRAAQTNQIKQVKG